MFVYARSDEWQSAKSQERIAERNLDESKGKPDYDGCLHESVLH